MSWHFCDGAPHALSVLRPVGRQGGESASQAWIPRRKFYIERLLTNGRFLAQGRGGPLEGGAVPPCTLTVAWGAMQARGVRNSIGAAHSAICSLGSWLVQECLGCPRPAWRAERVAVYCMGEWTGGWVPGLGVAEAFAGR